MYTLNMTFQVGVVLCSCHDLPIFSMATLYLFPFAFAMLVKPKGCQGFGLRDGFINSFNLPVFQLRFDLILQSIHETEQYVFIRKVGNTKHEDSKLLHICPYVTCCFRSLNLCFISQMTLLEKKAFMMNSSRNCSHVLMMHIPFPISGSFCFHHGITISMKCSTAVLMFVSSFFTQLHLKLFFECQKNISPPANHEYP